jgi:hypothetical protein
VKILRVLAIITSAAVVIVGASACAAPKSNVDPVKDAIHQSFGDNPTMEQHALYIAQRESGLNPNAVNANGGYYGLFQLSKYWHEKLCNSLGYQWSQITDPYVNAKVARALYNQVGWQPWGG